MWTVRDSSELYKIRSWGAGYYRVNAAGHVSVSPNRTTKHQIDLRELMDQLRKRNIEPPVLIRFMDILSDRIKLLSRCFAKARANFSYGGDYYPIYPIKVNQQRQVVDAMIKKGHKYHLGLEVGSKTELLAVLALSPGNDTLIICNGYKDDRFIEIALYAKYLGKSIILVAEQLAEVHDVIRLAKQLDVKPSLGLRVKLSVKDNGKWSESSGDSSKFGLQTYELMQAIQLLEGNGMLPAFELVHFHIGSQISNIAVVQDAMVEVSQVYASLCKMNVGIRYVDVGGGLGIDYDGTDGENVYSVNYTIQEYANNVVCFLKDVCTAQELPCPHILTESGRALTAHYSVLVTNVIGEVKPGSLSAPAEKKSKAPLIGDLQVMLRDLDSQNCLEFYHDALYARKEALSQFKAGQISLVDRSSVDELFWQVMHRINKIRKEEEITHHEFDQLDQLLSTTYLLNFSIFQSLPDCWAIQQVFPIMPLQRLDEKPDVATTLADLTCDSDGRITNYIGTADVSHSLPLHALRGEGDYYIGFFLVGAYQEILGDLHNLFGDTNAVHVAADASGRYRIDHVVKGDQVETVLEYLDYQSQEMVEMLRCKLETDIAKGLITVESAAKLMSFFEQGLSDYTYLTASSSRKS